MFVILFKVVFFLVISFKWGVENGLAILLSSLSRERVVRNE